MTDQVLSDAELSEIAVTIANTGATMVTQDYGHAVVRAVIAALAARSGVDVVAVAIQRCSATNLFHVWSDGRQVGVCSYCEPIADAIRLALATAEARHEADETYYDLQRERDALKEREAMWREYAEHCSFQNWTDKTKARVTELRRALGLEG